jgi:TatD DNase family protein
MRLFDAHCHLQDGRFAGRLPDLLDQAGQAGVERWACCGTSEADWPAVLRVARARPGVVPGFGIHPWHVGGRSAAWARTLERFLRLLPSGVGEIGLDRRIEPRDEAIQEEVFLAQLELARRLRRPAVIHCLRAWGRLRELLDRFGDLPAGMMLHAFGGSREMIGPLAARGAYFSFCAAAFYPRGRAMRDALLAVPLERLLLETDAPDFPPEPEGRAVNEPRNLALLLDRAAALRGLDRESLAATAWENACRLFATAMP